LGIAKGCKSNLAWAEGLKLPSPLKLQHTMRDRLLSVWMTVSGRFATALVSLPPVDCACGAAPADGDLAE